jgi:hypothetical protein
LGGVLGAANGHARRRTQGRPDERSSLEAEIARLQGENATRKKELLARALLVPGENVVVDAAQIEPVSRNLQIPN